MAISRLESLPNEILIELFEKYINGVDTITAFRFQLNQRFDLIIGQCQQFKFNFIKCHKKGFCFSMGLLLAYINNIEQLALSEQNAPGQIYAFFSFFPSFEPFKQLRELHLNISVDAVQPKTLTQALLTLSKTNLHTLYLEINESAAIRSLDNIIRELFRMATLKKLSIIGDEPSNDRINWEILDGLCSNIEYLTIKGVSCDFENMRHIFQCASGLKYADLTLQTKSSYYSYRSKALLEKPITEMSKLHTMIITITASIKSTQKQIESLFNCMPSLYRLELTIDEKSFDVKIWETLVTNSLPQLTSFTLQSVLNCLNDDNARKILDTIDTPFWTARKHFNIILKQYAESITNQQFFSSLKNSAEEGSDKFVQKWCILPQRPQDGIRFSPTEQISNVFISSESTSLLQNCYLNNVEHLVIDEINDNLLELLSTHVNIFQVKHFDISKVKKISDYLLSLVIQMKKLRSLRINKDQLTALQLTPLINHDRLNFVDLSPAKLNLNEQCISSIAKTFPYAEHLCIDTLDLQNVPLFKVYLPHLCCFTFTIFEARKVNFSEDYDAKKFDADLQAFTKFFFYRKEKWLTVWLDQAAYEEDFWQSHGSDSNNFNYDRLMMLGNEEFYESPSSDEFDSEDWR